MKLQKMRTSEVVEADPLFNHAHDFLRTRDAAVVPLIEFSSLCTEIYLKCPLCRVFLFVSLCLHDLTALIVMQDSLYSKYLGFNKKREFLKDYSFAFHMQKII